MSKRTEKEFLLDISESARRIISYTEGMEYDDFLVDLKTQDSVIRNIEIIGEAVKNLSPRNPEYGWLIYQEMIVWQKSYIPPISSAGQHNKPHCSVRERLMKL